MAVPAPTAAPTRRRFVAAAAVAALLYGFALPMLGLMHMGSSSMYANLKHWGGSNHLITPTGLLQDWYAEADGAMGDLFGGGLVRVDAARGLPLESLNAWSELDPAPLAETLLRDAGHSGRQLAAYYAPGRMASLKAAGHETAAQALPAAMPAFELRRALAAANASRVEAEVRVVRLQSKLRTPAEWLAHKGPELLLTSARSCSVTARGAPKQCDDAQARIAVPPPRRLAWLLLPYPAPLLPGDGAEIHCSA